jgi:hypothetical protein
MSRYMADAADLQKYAMGHGPCQVDEIWHIFHLDSVVLVVPLFEKVVRALHAAQGSQGQDVAALRQAYFVYTPR